MKMDRVRHVSGDRILALALVLILVLTGCGSGKQVPIRGQKPETSGEVSGGAADVASGGAGAIPTPAISEEKALERAEQLTARMSLDEKVSQMVVGYMDIREAAKYFPEESSTMESSGDIIPESQESLMTVRQTASDKYIPRISAGVDKIMMSIRSYPKITAMITPAFMSFEIVTSLLRTEMGFDGVVYTPPLNDYRLQKRYPEDTDGYLAVEAVKAGCDVLYQPKDKARAIQALRIAVNTGNMSEERINASVVRILKEKLKKNPEWEVK